MAAGTKISKENLTPATCYTSLPARSRSLSGTWFRSPPQQAHYPDRAYSAQRKIVGRLCTVLPLEKGRDLHKLPGSSAPYPGSHSPQAPRRTSTQAPCYRPRTSWCPSSSYRSAFRSTSRPPREPQGCNGQHADPVNHQARCTRTFPCRWRF